jgi:dipeptidyl-peptidase-4
MKRIIPSLIFLLLANIAIAQQKMLTMEDAMLNARTTLAPENLKQLQFIKGTSDYVYLKKTDGTESWVKGNFKSASETVFLTLQQFNEKLRSASLDTVKALTAVQFNADSWIVNLKGQRLSLNPLTNEYKVLIDKNTASKENVERSEAGYIAYVDKFNLFVSKNNDAKQVTTDGSKDIVYASSVHRDEFGIHKGTFWSNDGKQLAFYRMDQSMVTDYPIIDWTKYPAVNENIKYPMAGGKSHHVTVGVYNTANNTTTWLKTGEPAEQYLTNIAWSPDNKYVFIAVVNRQQNHMWLNQYDAATGTFVKTLV